MPVFLTSALSAASSQLFTSSRAIYGLAASGNAPRIFLKTLPNGLPFIAIIFNSCFTLLSYVCGSQNNSGLVFVYFSNMAAIAGLLTWLGISITYLRFYKGMKAQGYVRSALPYYSNFQPFAAWYAVCSISLVLLMNGWLVFRKWDSPTFVTKYLALVLFPILYLGARIYFREGPKKPHEMDFVSNIPEFEAETYDEPPPRNAAEALWQWLMWFRSRDVRSNHDKAGPAISVGRHGLSTIKFKWTPPIFAQPFRLILYLRLCNA